MTSYSDREDTVGPSTRGTRHFLEELDSADAFVGLYDDKIVHVLERLYRTLVTIDDELHDCSWFHLMQPQDLWDLQVKNVEEGRLVFWRGLNLVLTYVLRSSVQAPFTLMKGLITAVHSRNELLLALIARAFVEHASVLSYVDMTLSEKGAHLREVFASCSSDINLAACMPTEEDHDLYIVLFRCALGKKAEVRFGDLPNEGASVRAWERFNKDSVNGVPPERQALSICMCLDKLAKVKRFRWVNTIYAMLSEYCHPNAASRAIEHDVHKNDVGTFYITLSSQRATSPAFNRIYRIVNETLSRLIYLRMRESFAALSTCRMPMAPLEISAEDGVPPIGYLPEVDEHGRRYYYPLMASEYQQEVLTELTAEQVRRAECVFSLLADCYPGIPVAQFIHAFAVQAPRSAEIDLRLFEHMASVYQLELNERPPLDRDARKLLFTAAFFSRAFSTAGELLSFCPSLKRLDDWERVFDRIRDCGLWADEI